MPHLYVSVRLNGIVADQRLCRVRDEVWLGSAPNALVSFPGPALRVVRHGDALQVQGRWLHPGKPVRMVRDTLEVQLEAIRAAPSRREVDWVLPDLRVLVASAAVVLLGAWWEAMGAFLDRHPGAVASLSGSIEEQVAPAAVLGGQEAEADDTGLPCYACEASPLGQRPSVEYLAGE